MKIKCDKRLFWFFKDGAELDLDKPAELDTYVQQVLSHGKTADVQRLLKMIPLSVFQESFQRKGRFFKKPIRLFWEDFLANH